MLAITFGWRRGSKQTRLGPNKSGLIGGYATRDNISFFPASVVKLENCEEKHQIHDCPIKASFIKYWPGRWDLARSIAGIPEKGAELGQPGETHEVMYLLLLSFGDKHTS